jgi:hypothetical protein
MLMPASALVNGVSIVQATRVEQVDHFPLELATHDVIFAEGAAAESFTDAWGMGCMWRQSASASPHWRVNRRHNG